MFSMRIEGCRRITGEIIMYSYDESSNAYVHGHFYKISLLLLYDHVSVKMLRQDVAHPDKAGSWLSCYFIRSYVNAA